METEGEEGDVASFEEIETLLQSEGEKGKENTEEFESFFESLQAEYFKSHELAFLGAAHASEGLCANQNELASQQHWDNLKILVPVLDSVREELGHPIRLNSIYRNKQYNECVGGVIDSQHLQFNAADCVALGVPVLKLYQKVLDVRRTGLFKGGVGLYRTFVHIDTRGVNVDWVASSAIL